MIIVLNSEHVLGVLMIMGLLLMRAYNDQFNQIHGIMRGGGGLPDCQGLLKLVMVKLSLLSG